MLRLISWTDKRVWCHWRCLLMSHRLSPNNNEDSTVRLETLYRKAGLHHGLRLGKQRWSESQPDLVGMPGHLVGVFWCRAMGNVFIVWSYCGSNNSLGHSWIQGHGRYLEKLYSAIWQKGISYGALKHSVNATYILATTPMHFATYIQCLIETKYQ